MTSQKQTTSQSTSLSIPKWLAGSFSEKDFTLVEEAIQKAEEKTSGEIVPVIVKSSSTTAHIPLVLFFIFTTIYLGLGLTSVINEDWFENLWFTIASVVLMWSLSRGFAGLMLVQRLLTPKGDQKHQVENRALLEFYESGLQNTEHQTGVLIFISLMEHQAVVLADQRIASHHGPETWQDMIQLVVEGIKEQSVASGLVRGIQICSDILEKSFPIQENDENELPNHLVIKEY